MFIISKRNFFVNRADGTQYTIRRDFIGEIPEDVAASPLIQAAIRSGEVATPAAHADAALRSADADAAEKAEAADIRPDAPKRKKTAPKAAKA